MLRHERGWRGAVGLITAYAFVLQAFSGLQCRVTGCCARRQLAHTLSVICINDDTKPPCPADARAPARQPTHCPICTLTASASLIAPDLVELPPWQSTWSVGLSYLSKRVFIFVEVRCGVSAAHRLSRLTT